MSRRQQPSSTSRSAKRVAIYTRKSTEEGLDKDFNTLDAQRESGESYAASQIQEGWTVSPTRYDDGGYTGGNLDRPALQRLLADIASGAIDVILVYKVDRLSRSLLDFARLMETFDKHHVTFVSVTQPIHSGHSMGRLMLNVLLSFAQFEREVIGERTRDKMAATRRKGKWTGGTPPLGYDVDVATKRLVVNQAEAKMVRAIFAMYLKHRSLLKVLKELRPRGWINKRWATRKGHSRGGRPFIRSALHRLLTNPIYCGLARYKSETHPGEHDAIVDESVFQQVQQILRDNCVVGEQRARNSSGAILKGILKCGPCGCSMVPSFTKKRNRLYRYYTCCQAQRCGWSECPTKAVAAGQIEQFIVDRIATIGTDPHVLQATIEEAQRLDEEQRVGLDNERRAVERDLERHRGEVQRLVADRSTPSVAGQLGGLKDRIAELEQRQAAVEAALAKLVADPLDDANIAAALVQFQPIWNALTQAERGELVDHLIERVDFDGAKGKVTIAFRPTGLRAFSEQAQQLEVVP